MVDAESKDVEIKRRGEEYSGILLYLSRRGTVTTLSV